MKKFKFFYQAFFLAVLSICAIACPGKSDAAGMAQNDFRYGAEGLKQDTFSLMFPASRNLILGAEASVYKTNEYEKVHSAKIPVSYAGRTNLASFKPFIYSHHLGMTAFGGQISLSTIFSLQNETKDSIMLSITGSHAIIKGEKTSGDIEKFSQTAFEMKAEAEVQSNFKFIAGGAGYLSPSKNMKAEGLSKSVFDMKDLADINAYQIIRELPEWAANVKFIRNFQPDFNNSFYAGYSKISFRNSHDANSYIAGMEFFVSEETTWDIGYNYFKYHDKSASQYFRIFVSTVF